MAASRTARAGGPAYPGTDSTYVVIPSGQIKATIVAPVQSIPQPTPIPVPKGRHALKIRLLITWTWDYGITRIRRIKIDHFPHGTHLMITCKGKGCPRPLKLSAKGPKHIHALLKGLTGRRYRTGAVLMVSLTARGWHRERARIVIRRGRKPRVTRA